VEIDHATRRIGPAKVMVICSGIGVPIRINVLYWIMLEKPFFEGYVKIPY
jgi:hypothetical protein